MEQTCLHSILKKAFFTLHQHRPMLLLEVARQKDSDCTVQYGCWVILFPALLVTLKGQFCCEVIAVRQHYTAGHFYWLKKQNTAGISCFCCTVIIILEEKH